MKGFIQAKTFAVMAALVIVITAVSCGKKSESTSANSDPTITAVVVANLNTVGTSYSPDSLKSSTGVKLMADLCAGTDLFGCQPRLIKEYIFFSKQLLAAVRMMMEGVGKGLGHLADGAKGTVTVSDLPQTSIIYKKISDTVYDVIMVNTTSTDTFLDISVNGNVYSLKWNFERTPSALKNADTPTQGSLDAVVTYTDANNWTSNIAFLGMACNVLEPRAPERIRIIMSKSNSMWSGKAMLYNGRWAYDDNVVSCNSTENDLRSMNLYTDFVGNQTAAKAKVYMMRRSVSNFNNDETYALSNFLNTYNTGWSINLSAYSNPFCTTGPTNITWNNECSGTSSDVASASFGLVSDWVQPNVFYLESSSFRTSQSILQ